jgi:hypothetical protein
MVLVVELFMLGIQRIDSETIHSRSAR